MFPGLYIHRHVDYKLAVVWEENAKRLVNDSVAFVASTALVVVPNFEVLDPQQRRDVMRGLDLVWDASMWDGVCEKIPAGFAFQIERDALVAGLDRIVGSVDSVRHVRVDGVSRVDEDAWIVRVHAWL